MSHSFNDLENKSRSTEGPQSGPLLGYCFEMNPVQQKISCVYDIDVCDEASSKRHNQLYRVVATGEMNLVAEQDGVNTTAKVTEKLDGTCCLVQEFQGRPWLWARYDRKPSKAGERRLALFNKSKLKQIQNEGNTEEVFKWDPKKDFKEPPQHWVPATQLEKKDGFVMPDKLGHTPGWIPIEPGCRQQCWHLSSVDLELGVALVLSQDTNEPDSLVLKSQSLSSLCGQTCELIGTNINGNPYSLGTKQSPVHILVPHGSISVECPRPSDYKSLCDWFTSESPESLIEGIVWHCGNGALYKLHRHHLNLKWPLPEAHLFHKKVLVQVKLPETVADSAAGSGKQKVQSLLSRLSQSQVLNSLKDLHLMFKDDPTAAVDT
ncbi:hypothetical protein Bpfe_015416 [Biomphalaria pfeifferi]|uniref:RNA ligase 1 n=1 Tax=Biomphalaria pfeifferi TaxID=112525 RepID=A0AAD8BKA7_BIOPF|nr:hypothetical protein Bpfe_015416 [Biomphalaria pfeifferi]